MASGRTGDTALVVTGVATLLVACAAAPGGKHTDVGSTSATNLPGDATARARSTEQSGAPPAPPAASTPLPASSAKVPATASPPRAEPAVADQPLSAFPPPNIPVPSAKSAAKGDGVWTAFGTSELGERAAKGPFIARTVLHPHPDSRFLTVTLAAINLSRVALRQVAGTEDLLWANLPVDPASSGRVPTGDRDRLLAVMNGGFQPKHGRWGIRVDDRTSINPPRDAGCTLAVYRDETVRLATWSKLADTLPSMRSFRQTPPCLLEGGAVHPALLRGDDKRWAGHAADLQTRRRSAAGLDASGHVLFYAMGEEASPRWLAEALRLAGAASALELDINWYWTRFLLFGEPHGEPLQVTSTLIPKMEHLARGYVERPSTRDFFYLIER